MINNEKIETFMHLAFGSRQYLIDKFWQRVNKTGQCWIWEGTKNKQGYGQVSIRVNGQPLSIRAHRISWALLFGVCHQLPFDHLCKNRACVKPAHLDPVTTAENNRRLTKTHCLRGHELTAESTLKTKNGRECRACKQQRRHQ